MTQDEIIEMAEQVGFEILYGWPDSFYAFAKLVAEKKVEGMVVMTPDELKSVWDKAQAEEREACAKVCEDISITGILLDAISCNHTKNFCAHTIRARNNK